MRRTARCAVVGLLLPAAVAAQESTAHVYDVDPSLSHIVAITHRAGLLSFLGHEHAVLATEFTAALCLRPDEPHRSALRLSVPTRSLVIDSDTARKLARLGGGPGEDKREEIARKLIDERRLDADAHPTLSFETTSVLRTRADALQVRGRLTIKGTERDVTFPASLTHGPDDVRLQAKLRIKLSDFGVLAETIAGVVKVANDVDLLIDLVARPTADKCAVQHDVRR
jgi:polyisoprenoid-binding protein YceI